MLLYKLRGSFTRAHCNCTRILTLYLYSASRPVEVRMKRQLWHINIVLMVNVTNPSLLNYIIAYVYTLQIEKFLLRGHNGKSSLQRKVVLILLQMTSTIVWYRKKSLNIYLVVYL